MRVSVVIPVWNDAALLDECLRALAAQDRPADEIIVVDNNSSDGSADVARAYGVRVILEPRQGIAPASSTGFDAATGELIARLDADSVAPPDWLRRIERFAIDAGPLTVITGPGAFYDSNRFSAWVGHRLYLGSFFSGFRILLGHSPIFGSNFMMSRQLWLRVRGSVHSARGNIHDDIDLSYQLQPDMTVKFVRSIEVGISGRPLATASGLLRRISWVYTTLFFDFRDQSPVARRLARRRWLSARAEISADTSRAA